MSTASALPFRAWSRFPALCDSSVNQDAHLCSIRVLQSQLDKEKIHLLPTACPANSMGRDLLFFVLQRCTLMSKQAGFSQLVVSAREESHRLQQKQHSTDSMV